MTGIALLLGPLVGALLLFATDASFDVVNVASDVVYVVALPFAAIATTYLYFDLAERSSSTRRSRVVEQIGATIQLEGGRVEAALHNQLLHFPAGGRGRRISRVGRQKRCL